MKTTIRTNWTDGKGNILFYSEQENLSPEPARCFTPAGVELKGTPAENLEQTRLPLTDTEKAEAYRDWFNNYTTLRYFARCKGLTEEQAKVLIAEGKVAHEASVKPAPRTFTCLTVSSNTNSFGYRAALFLAEDGTGFECLYSFGSELPKRGDRVAEDKLPTYCRRELPREDARIAKKILKSL